MNLKDFQKQHHEWQVKNFGQAPPWQLILGAMEELGELSHAYLKCSQGIRIDESHRENIIDAVGDIVIYLSGLCSTMDIDLEKAITETWAKVRQRDWKKFPVDGVSE